MVVGTDEVNATGLYSVVRPTWPWWRRRTEGRGRGGGWGGVEEFLFKANGVNEAEAMTVDR